jgi:GT2 family glycosyltransferase
VTEVGQRAPICVVVPVYGARESVLRCAAALISTVDHAVDSVIFVNDCGPDADRIERDILKAIAAQPSFSYARNARNLGFVGTCNRAALELAPPGVDLLLLNSDAIPTAGWMDELAAVLAHSPEHGVVCARSDNATIASLPFRLRNPSQARSRQRTAEVHSALVDTLPQFSVTPVAMGFCFLVRRSLIDQFGLFDQAFAPGYGEENDFCLRMRDQGYLSVMAHRALVFHEVGQSFPSPQRVRLRSRHERLLRVRHPEYPALVHRYLHADIDAVDAFADCLVLPHGETPRILIAVGEHSVGRAELIASLEGRAQLSVLGAPADAAGVDRVPDSLSNRVWDLCVVVGDVPRLRTVVARASSARQLNLDRIDGTSAERVLRAVEAGIDVQDLRSSWKSLVVSKEELGLLRPPRQRTRTRVLARLDEYLPRVSTKLREFIARRGRG